MRKPAPINEPLTALSEPMQSRSWKQWYGEAGDFYEQVLRWTDPFHPSYGKVEPPVAIRKRGLLVYANGSTWNPGSGEGLYRWSAASWVYIG